MRGDDVRRRVLREAFTETLRILGDPASRPAITKGGRFVLLIGEGNDENTSTIAFWFNRAPRERTARRKR